MAMADVSIRSNPAELLPRLPDANVGSTERLMMLLAGAALLGYAWKNSSKKMALASAGMLLRGTTGYCPAYAAMGVNHADTREALSGPRGIHVRESITIDAPVEDLYRFWRSLDRLPEVIPQLERVEQLDARRSRWTAKAFDAVPVTWEAEIISDVAYETIGWKTLPGEAIQHAGSVNFKPAFGDHGTEVRVHLQYSAPGGKAAGWLAWLAGQDPGHLTREGLRALKRRLEGGEPAGDVAADRSPSPAPVH
jgi:uncharacterized membrane protein